MKLALTLTAVLMSGSVFATDFTAKLDNTFCTIEAGQVTRVATFGKETKASFTETKSVKMDGLAPLIEKAIATSRDAHASEEFAFTMKHEGKTYILNIDDSRESQTLIQMISRICR